jgi:hypothetical protein
MIEADLENLSSGGGARDMSAELAVSRVRAHDHRQRIQANDRCNAALPLQFPAETGEVQNGASHK